MAASAALPWGISESAYAARDLHFNYQYGPFGVPGLGLKRGLIEDLVVSPYSTILAANVFPHEAMQNLRALERSGALSSYGFYEALDFTPERVKKGEHCTIVHAYMAHHQGMSLIALNNLLNQGAMQNRFHAIQPCGPPKCSCTSGFRAQFSPFIHAPRKFLTGRVVRTLTGLVTRAYDTPDLPTPANSTALEWNVQRHDYHRGRRLFDEWSVGSVALASDTTRDNWGSFVYVRDVRSGAVWSAGYQPVCVKPNSYEVAFSEDKADFWRRDGGILTHYEVIVSGEDNSELRRVSVTNHSNRPREIELTSYAEVVLAPPASDLAHPAFSNLFVETEFYSPHQALLARRRPRSSEDAPVFGVHVLAASTQTIAGVQYETDRARFLGRGRKHGRTCRGDGGSAFVEHCRPVLDPIFSCVAA